MNSRRTADQDIPNPDRRLERVELMRNLGRGYHHGQRAAASHQQAGHMTAIAQEPSASQSACQRAVHIWSGLQSPVTASRRYRNDQGSEDHSRQSRLAGAGQTTRQCQPCLQADGATRATASIASRSYTTKVASLPCRNCHGASRSCRTEWRRRLKRPSWLWRSSNRHTARRVFPTNC